MPAPLNQRIRMVLRSMILDIINSDLTIGREDRDLQPFNNQEIREFIAENNNNIEQAVSAIMRDYEEDGELNDLLEPETDWVLEYLYDFVNTQDA